MKKSSLAVTFITLCYIFLILTLHNPLISRNVFAESPSFSSQEINTGIDNGIRVDGIKHTQTKADYKDSFDSSSDIQRVTYFSDGKTLNATVWLGGAVKQNPSLYGASTAVYGVLIDADNNPLTGKYGVDYQKEIQWSGNTHSWSSLFVQYSSPTNFRTLEVEKNYSGFFQNNQKYVLLPLNLKSITSPDRFRVLYYAILIYNESKILLDLTPWIDVPPSQYTFSTTPDPVLITQGEQKDIGVQLRSSTGILPKLVDFKPFQNYSNVKVIFNPNKLDVSSIGFAPVPLRLEVPSNAQIGKYTIPILLNMSTGSIFPSKFIQVGNLSVSIPSQGYISTKGNLSLSVIEPPSIDQRIKDFWSVYGSLISLVGAGFAGAASTFVFEYVKNHKGKNK
jgi:hypothetical protein